MGIIKTNVQILIVDDMKLLRKALVSLLHLNGYTTIIEAGDGATAWAALENNQYPIHLIISDWEMPQSTGLDLLKRVRSRESMKAIPFIMMSTGADKTELTRALNSGADGFLIKPFTSDSVRNTLMSLQKKGRLE